MEIEVAELFAAQRELGKAIDKLSQILEEFKLTPNDPALINAYDEVQSRRAYFLADLGKWQNSMAILEELKDRGNDDPISLFHLGYCYLRAGKLDDSRGLLERAVSIDPPPAIYVRAHCVLGKVLYFLGEFQKAKSEFEMVLGKAPAAYIRNAEIWKWLEHTSINLGLKDEAAKYRLLASAPS